MSFIPKLGWTLPLIHALNSVWFGVTVGETEVSIRFSTGMTGSPLGGGARGRGTVCVPMTGGNTENGREAPGAPGGLCPTCGS